MTAGRLASQGGPGAGLTVPSSRPTRADQVIGDLAIDAVASRTSAEDSIVADTLASLQTFKPSPSTLTAHPPLPTIGANDPALGIP